MKTPGISESKKKQAQTALVRKWENILTKAGLRAIDPYNHGHDMEYARKGKTLRGTKFKSRESEIHEYFTAVSTWAYYSTECKEEYRKILQDYCMTGSIVKSIKALTSEVSHVKVWYYLQANKQKMHNFSREYWGSKDE